MTCCALAILMPLLVPRPESQELMVFTRNSLIERTVEVFDSEQWKSFKVSSGGVSKTVKFVTVNNGSLSKTVKVFDSEQT